MKVAQTIRSILIGACLFAGCGKPVPAPSSAPLVDPEYGHLLKAQPKLPTIKVWLGDQELTAEIAREQVQIATGMMFRTNIDENESMIFVLPNTERAAFWMKNCFVPLSVAYISPDGVIQEIHPLEPQNTNSVIAASDNIRFALETKQGWFERYNVKPGTVIRTERGSLMGTFVRKQ